MNSNAPDSLQKAAAAPSTATSDARPRFPFRIMFFLWLIVVATATLVTFILPESYCSTARIKVERDLTDIRGLSEQSAYSAYDPYFVRTELEVIRSAMVLGKVANGFEFGTQFLDLNTLWGRKYHGGEKLKTTETIGLLKCRLSLRPVWNTSFIEIKVYSEDKREAADIANAIAEAYRAHRQERRRQLILDALETLEDRSHENRVELQAVQAQMENLVRIQDPQTTNRLNELKKEFENLERFGQALALKTASEKVDLNLPATRMVQIVDRAVPGLRPVRPNKRLNVALAILVGGLVGFLLAMLVYLLRRRAHWQTSTTTSGSIVRTFRSVLHALILCVLGVSLGYLLAMPITVSSLLFIPFWCILGGIASAYVERINLNPAPLSDESKGRGRNGQNT